MCVFTSRAACPGVDSHGGKMYNELRKKLSKSEPFGPLRGNAAGTTGLQLPVKKAMRLAGIGVSYMQKSMKHEHERLLAQGKLCSKTFCVPF